jgi:hypothetical protein
MLHDIDILPHHEEMTRLGGHDKSRLRLMHIDIDVRPNYSGKNRLRQALHDFLTNSHHVSNNVRKT